MEEKQHSDPNISLWNVSLTVVSAENLPNVRRIPLAKTQASAVILMKGLRWETESDCQNNLNPCWDKLFPFHLTQSPLQYPFPLTIKLYCRTSGNGRREIGEVKTTMGCLFKNSNEDCHEFPIIRKEKDSNGVLKIQAKFEEVRTRKKDYGKKVKDGIHIILEVAQVVIGLVSI